jgi:CheY-like chemotaxis protein
MGGEIRIASTKGIGTKVVTLLPLQPLVMESTRKPTPVLINPPDLANTRILLAEDNEINQLIFREMLSNTGAKLHIVENGVEAIALVEAQIEAGTPFDIVFLDIFMPVMDGISACIELKKRYPQLLLVSITANVTESDIARYKATGFDEHIGKPVEMGQLFGLLNTHSK